MVMENIQSHKSVANSTLYNVAMKGFHYCHTFLFELLLSVSLGRNSHLQLQHISVSTNEPGIKSEIYGVVCQVASKSKIQLISCNLSPKSLLGLSALEDIRAIDAYIVCDSI